MDSTDAKILETLREHGRWSIQKVAKQTHIPITTVHYRMRKLESEGIIEKYTITINHAKMGLPLSAYILIVVDYDDIKKHNISQRELAQQFLRMNYVESTSILAGRMDIILRVRVPSVDELNKFVVDDLRNIRGVERTETMLILSDVNGK